jgi:UDP-N-acetylglucosamine:LPS N-acetylglucosamine transferase
VVFPQVSLTPGGLVEAVGRLLADPAALAAMGARARSLAVPDAADRIVRLLFEVVGASPLASPFASPSDR